MSTPIFSDDADAIALIRSAQGDMALAVSTLKGAGFSEVVSRPKHGCHNREPFADGYMHTARRWHDGAVRDMTTWVPHVMTTECQTIKTDYPPLREGCAGCRRNTLEAS